MRNLLGAVVLILAGFWLGMNYDDTPADSGGGVVVAPAPKTDNLHVKPTKQCKKTTLTVPGLGTWPVVDGVSDAVLDSGVVGRFPESAAPGAMGNYSVIAHRITHGEPFRYLPDVDKGAPVVLECGSTRYTYKVTSKFVVDYTDVSVLESTDEPVITLITCNSLAPTDDRLIVRGRLVKVTPVRG